MIPLCPPLPSPKQVLLLLAAPFALAACELAGTGSMEHGLAVAAPGTHSSSPGEKNITRETARHSIDTRYPPEIDRHPGLLDTLAGHRQAACTGLMPGVGPSPATSQELSLRFVLSAEAPRLVVVAAECDLYIEGVWRETRVEYFAWMPGRRALLSNRALVPHPAGWSAINAYLQPQLDAIHAHHVALDAALPGPHPGRSANPRARNTQVDAAAWPFIPRLGADGRITALEFVPPSEHPDENTSLAVPASVLKPHVATAYLALFAATP